MIRVYIALAVVAVLGGLLWHDKLGWDKAKARKAEVEQLESTLTAERLNRQIEQEDRKRADQSAKSLEAELAAIRGAPKPPSVFCRPARLSAASEGGASPSASPAATGPGLEEPLTDIGALVRDVWIEAKSNDARHSALIEWEQERTH